MLKKIMVKAGFIKPAINDALIVLVEKELRTLTQCKDNFVEVIHPSGYKSRHRLRLTIFNRNNFVYKRDRVDFWNHLQQEVEVKLPGKLNRVCINGHLYKESQNA